MTNTSNFIRTVLNGLLCDNPLCEKCGRIVARNNNNTQHPIEHHGSNKTEEELRATTRRPLSSAKITLLMQSVKNFIPKLSCRKSKGECGRIGVFGGATLYTGASYLAAISALRCGADMLHIFCTKEAGPVLRGFCPDMLIHPNLDQEYGLVELDAWLPLLDCVVLGHGLGHSQHMVARVAILMEKVRQYNIPVVIDGDGLLCAMKNPDIVRNYPRAVLTPNADELVNLAQIVLCRTVDKSICPDGDVIQEIANGLGNLTVIQKGATDLISNGNLTEECYTAGSPRRCGGQGVILSGVLATFLSWAYREEHCQELNLPVLAGWGACSLVRECAEQGFRKCGRGMTAEDMIQRIDIEFRRLFESETFF